MNRVSRVSVWASKVVTLGVVAACLSCGGGDDNGANGAGGKGISGTCSLAAGTYTIHYTIQSGSNADCQSIPDETTTVAMNESATNLMAGTTMTTGGADGGTNCTASETGCSVTETCSDSSGGATVQLS